MYKKIAGIVAMLAALVLSPVVFADDMGCGGGLKGMLQSLKLSDDQKAKIAPIMDQMKAGMKDSAAQFMALDKQINDQVNSDKMDQAAVSSLVDQKTKLIGSMIKAKLAAKNQIMAILTPDQKTAILGMMQKMEDKIAAKYKSCHGDD